MIEHYEQDGNSPCIKWAINLAKSTQVLVYYCVEHRKVWCDGMTWHDTETDQSWELKEVLPDPMYQALLRSLDNQYNLESRTRDLIEDSYQELQHIYMNGYQEDRHYE